MDAQGFLLHPALDAAPFPLALLERLRAIPAPVGDAVAAVAVADVARRAHPLLARAVVVSSGTLVGARAGDRI